MILMKGKGYTFLEIVRFRFVKQQVPYHLFDCVCQIGTLWNIVQKGKCTKLFVTRNWSFELCYFCWLLSLFCFIQHRNFQSLNWKEQYPTLLIKTPGPTHHALPTHALPYLSNTICLLKVFNSLNFLTVDSENTALLIEIIFLMLITFLIVFLLGKL